MGRGRTPADSDDAAISAQAEIAAFLDTERITPTELGRRAGVTSATANKVVQMTPARWTPGFTKIVKYINSHKATNASAGSEKLSTHVRRLEEGAVLGSAAAAAALLRAVADLLENQKLP